MFLDFLLKNIRDEDFCQGDFEDHYGMRFCLALDEVQWFQFHNICKKKEEEGGEGSVVKCCWKHK